MGRTRTVGEVIGLTLSYSRPTKYATRGIRSLGSLSLVSSRSASTSESRGKSFPLNTRQFQTCQRRHLRLDPTPDSSTHHPRRGANTMSSAALQRPHTLLVDNAQWSQTGTSPGRTRPQVRDQAHQHPDKCAKRGLVSGDQSQWAHSSVERR